MARYGSVLIAPRLARSACSTCSIKVTHHEFLSSSHRSTYSLYASDAAHITQTHLAFPDRLQSTERSEYLQVSTYWLQDEVGEYALLLAKCMASDYCLRLVKVLEAFDKGGGDVVMVVVVD